MSSVEVWLAAPDGNGNGGDFVQTDNGDLLLAYDTPNTSDATVQRLIRLLTTNPRLIAADGRPISTPGDLFYPNYGAGEPALVDQPLTQGFIASLKARILNALLQDPTVAPIPQPQVVVTKVDTATVQVAISLETVAGNPVAFVLPTG